LFIFGILGFFMKTLNYPIAPMILAMVLGDRSEDAFRQSMLLSQGSLTIFFERPLSATISILTLIFLAMPIVSLLRRRSTKKAID
jgi:TctA family transporter